MTRLLTSTILTFFLFASPAFTMPGEMQIECYFKNGNVRESLCKYTYIDSFLKEIFNSKLEITHMIKDNLDDQFNKIGPFACEEMAQIVHQTNEKIGEIVSAVEELTGLPIEELGNYYDIEYDEFEKDFCEKIMMDKAPSENSKKSKRK